MNLLRIFCSLSAVPVSCRWVLFNDAGAHPGVGALAQLPQGAARIELVLAASDVLLVSARLPSTGNRRSAALLAYAVEERLASDPDAAQVSILGRRDGEDVLAVVDRLRLQAWRDALAAAGITVDSVHCETLMLPLQHGEWSLCWNGQEGHVRIGEFEGGATDCGDRHTPPLALQQWLAEARAHAIVPTTIALYLTAPAAKPDLEAWQSELGVSLRIAVAQDWHTTAVPVGARLDQRRRRWYPSAAMVVRWRPIGWMLLVALLLHSAALLGDRMRLASEQQQLRQQMEARFRALFPDAVAVADPVLQMRRQLTRARHAANQPDAGDFPIMLGKVSAVLAAAPTAPLHALSYENGRMTLEWTALDDVLARRTQQLLMDAGFAVEMVPAARSANRGTVTLTLRSP
ncbi:general secretion pathway L [Rhodanobacter fulvus Jip2]|uniref:Type II secretion system protein L n=1 Tax=Rhodanobacter fulvus Jip2 TaxID=1163408 RepID=I4VMQ7_9GAMM|nr:type II secretion system protein GspL [Rhodanobacter fulvus]EIL88498.1 general secretion pathway L [Rhodanobacter fulvus Jip2]